MAEKEQEQRHFSRIPFDCDATIIDQTVLWPTQLLDVSLNGALVTRPSRWQPKIGNEYQLRLKLSSIDTIHMKQVVVTHIHDDRIGFQCKIIDIDSITHLKRLLELNLGDPELVHRELAALGNHKKNVQKGND